MIRWPFYIGVIGLSVTLSFCYHRNLIDRVEAACLDANHRHRDDPAADLSAPWRATTGFFYGRLFPLIALAPGAAIPLTELFWRWHEARLRSTHP